MWVRNSDPDYYRWSQIKGKYGLTKAQWTDIWNRQNRACAICKTLDAVWHTDHDHETGAVRGILCAQCNHAIGLFGDDVKVLRNAIEYLS